MIFNLQKHINKNFYKKNNYQIMISNKRNNKLKIFNKSNRKLILNQEKIKKILNKYLFNLL